jgi:HAD superfamily phosphatase (TIGR01681 family)
MSRHDRQAPIIGSQSERIIAITATFTAEPVEEFLSFWSQELEIPFQVKFAPNNQVFQQLLDPASSIHKNKNGMNVILVRFEDWIRRDESSSAESSAIEKIEENVQDLVVATRAASERSATPHLVCVCPAPPATLVDMERMAFYERIEDLMAFELSSVDNVYLVNSSELATVYPVPMYYDSYADELGHMPYTSTFFAALGTLIARKYYATQSAPYKVIVLDCDQTLWKGICGEDGPLGIEIDPPRKRLQEFMVEQLHAGMLVCLCSKNNEQDVLEVFEHHPEMPLQREHIVSWRITWRPKSENIRSLAHELGLGLDSFVFVDDSPIECAEVIANCPQVLTLQLPSEA